MPGRVMAVPLAGTSPRGGSPRRSRSGQPYRRRTWMAMSRRAGLQVGQRAPGPGMLSPASTFSPGTSRCAAASLARECGSGRCGAALPGSRRQGPASQRSSQRPYSGGCGCRLPRAGRVYVGRLRSERAHTPGVRAIPPSALGAAARDSPVVVGDLISCLLCFERSRELVRAVLHRRVERVVEPEVEEPALGGGDRAGMRRGAFKQAFGGFGETAGLGDDVRDAVRR